MGAPADECASERAEHLVDVGTALGVDHEAAEPVEPRERVIHHPATEPVGALNADRLGRAAQASTPEWRDVQANSDVRWSWPSLSGETFGQPMRAPPPGGATQALNATILGVVSADEAVPLGPTKHELRRRAARPISRVFA